MACVCSRILCQSWIVTSQPSQAASSCPCPVVVPQTDKQQLEPTHGWRSHTVQYKLSDKLLHADHAQTTCRHQTAGTRRDWPPPRSCWFSARLSIR